MRLYFQATDSPKQTKRLQVHAQLHIHIPQGSLRHMRCFSFHQFQKLQILLFMHPIMLLLQGGLVFVHKLAVNPKHDT